MKADLMALCVLIGLMIGVLAMTVLHKSIDRMTATVAPYAYVIPCDGKGDR